MSRISSIENQNDLPAVVTPTESVPARGLSRWCSLLLAGLFFVLAVLGAILPVLPTTPFLLLTSYFLARSSPKWQKRLLRSRWFGPILRDWQEHRGVRPKVKYQAITLVIVVVGLSCYLTSPTLPILTAILTLASIGIGVVICLPAVKNRK